jgi:hypothetical protein
MGQTIRSGGLMELDSMLQELRDHQSSVCRTSIGSSAKQREVRLVFMCDMVPLFTSTVQAEYPRA